MIVLAVILILAAVAFHALTTLVDLHPLNNVRDAKRSERRMEVAVNAPILSLPAVLLILAATLRLPVLGYIGAAVELCAVAGGLLLWWAPYIAGITMPWATAGSGTTWSELHARTYARTVIVLPRVGDRPRPNLEHMILHGLMLAAVITTIVATTAL